MPFTPTLRSAAYAANPGDLVACDATAGPFTVTLPDAPAGGVQVAVRLSASAGSAVTVACAGTDVIDGQFTETWAETFSPSSGWADATAHNRWYQQWVSGGTAGIETDGGPVFGETPQPPGASTYSALLTSLNVFSGDIDVTAAMKTVSQSRGTPNPWERAWLLWHYTANTSFYYLVLKANGWELGKEDPAYPGNQRFLATGASPVFGAGNWDTVNVRQTGAVIAVTVNSAPLVTFTDTERPYTAGVLGLYCEDSHARFGAISLATVTTSLEVPGQSVILQYDAGTWYVLDDSLTIGSLDGRYVPLAGGTMTGALNVEATATVTGLKMAAGAAAGYTLQASDSAGDAAWRPAGGPPSGAAGGSLAGTYPNPSVAKLGAVAVTGTPGAGQVITATSGTAAAWSSVAATTGSAEWLIASLPALTFTSVIRNGAETPLSATVRWPDGQPGTWVADTLSRAFPGAVDAFHVTYGSVSVLTQAAVTRDKTGAVTAQPVPVVTPAVARGIRAAFFYPWYPGSWYPASHWTPVLGAPYNSNDPAAIAYQIAAMQYCNITAGISSWWGQSDVTNTVFAQILGVTAGTGFKWCLYYEPAMGTLASDLSYIYAQYAGNPAYLHVGGKPVLFVYTRSVSSCTDSATWVSTNAGRFYLNLQVFGGYTACPSQPDSWHQYGPASQTDHQPGYSFTISPGYWKYDDPVMAPYVSGMINDPYLPRSIPGWTAAAQAMVASGEPWQLVTTWNEWGEGSSVEESTSWITPGNYGAYADVLHAQP